MLGGFNLNSADYFHHLLFIPLLGFPGQVLRWGAVEPAGAIFISGLPGGVSYFLLGLQKMGLCKPVVEKRITANMNAWIRLPGILINSFIVYQALLYGRHTLPLWAPLLHVILPPYNGILYGKQSIANYAVHFLTTTLQQHEPLKEALRELIDSSKKMSVPVGMRADVVCSWREAMTVPQRGC